MYTFDVKAHLRYDIINIEKRISAFSSENKIQLWKDPESAKGPQYLRSKALHWNWAIYREQYVKLNAIELNILGTYRNKWTNQNLKRTKQNRTILLWMSHESIFRVRIVEKGRNIEHFHVTMKMASPPFVTHKFDRNIRYWAYAL